MNRSIKKIIRANNSAISFCLFGIGSLFIVSFIFPTIFVVYRNKEKRRLLFVNCIKYSWIIFVKIMKFLRLIKVNISKEDAFVLKNLKNSLVVSNHPSLIDVVILISLINRPICVAKGVLTRNFFMKFIVLKAYINNECSPTELIESSKEALDKGYNLIIFPEGTRSAKDKDMKLQRGAAYIALEGNYYIQTIHIDISNQILGKNQKWHDVGEERVVYNIKLKTNIKPTDIADYMKSTNINARKITTLIKNSIET